MTAVLLFPGPRCFHDSDTHCEDCIAEVVLPSLRVLRCSWKIMQQLTAELAR